MPGSRFLIWTIIVFVLLPVCLLANIETKTVALNYISPDEIVQALALRKDPAGCFVFHQENDPVQVRLNHATNELLLTGDGAGMVVLLELIQQLDVAPRQFVIEAKIVEIDNQRSREIGLDWQYVLDQINFNSQIAWDKTKQTVFNEIPVSEYSTKREQTNDRKFYNISQSARLGEFLKLINESGAGKTTNVPRIVTTNNKQGTIFDGQKIKYVAKLSSFANIYETEELASGLMLSVTPSLGKSGYLKLKVKAKLTFLAESGLDTDTPVESGQSLENMVIMKDGESLVLGGFKRTEKYKVKKKVPLLGTILPFLFSNEYELEKVKDVLIILTPEIIDLNLPEVPEMP